MSGHPDLRCLIDEAPTADAGERQAVLAHVACCADCRAALTATEPARLFALLGTDPVPESVLRRVSDGVALALDAEVRRPLARRWTGPLAVAASLVLALMLGTYLGRHGARPPGLAAARPARAVEAASPAMFELLEPPGTARMVRIKNGETEVVMIFTHKAMDL